MYGILFDIHLCYVASRLIILLIFTLVHQQCKQSYIHFVFSDAENMPQKTFLGLDQLLCYNWMVSAI